MGTWLAVFEPFQGNMGFTLEGNDIKHSILCQQIFELEFMHKIIAEPFRNVYFENIMINESVVGQSNLKHWFILNKTERLKTVKSA